MLSCLDRAHRKDFIPTYGVTLSVSNVVLAVVIRLSTSNKHDKYMCLSCTPLKISINI